ncbi:hypothetical protein KY290_033531 [Solanum tuberosum]|uniref:Aminotransferase-like plant mobile domain-containing protein n=1 Tax=Solanum tuberosum TaxID=4113 RepID=A0ABQ7U147_SOLTU|nr:hypothetical protein KY289_032890 [Solanum tuberosum]KAH0647536.1 hypothetical protein KY285_032784 [Solanum tuberosum]KAH0740488.1 hypothetical protein KY290_033531 [Solanum tuberosum]
MFTYDHNENVLQAFCENRCPSTNTVSTFVGELSFSLWDLRTIGGLRVHAFYRLTKGVINEVSIREWTKFWFMGPRKYVEPSLRMSKNHTKPRMNHDPSGNMDMSFLPRTEEENAPFVELGIEESFRDDTYLSTFLAHWLCKFVLPNKKTDYICVSVFKVAGLMTHGEIFSLAVPVLANIYRGLGDISTFSNMGACDILLPIHYVYGWICEYFETYYRVTRP